MSVLAEAHSGTRERERENLPTLPLTRTTEMAKTADVAIKITSALIDLFQLEPVVNREF